MYPSLLCSLLFLPSYLLFFSHALVIGGQNTAPASNRPETVVKHQALTPPPATETSPSPALRPPQVPETIATHVPGTSARLAPAISGIPEGNRITAQTSFSVTTQSPIPGCTPFGCNIFFQVVSHQMLSSISLTLHVRRPFMSITGREYQLNQLVLRLILNQIQILHREPSRVSC